MKKITCTVTGAAGNVAYALVFFIAQGLVFGTETKVVLNLVEVPEFASSLEGLKMEILDCAFPCIHEVRTGEDPMALFSDIDFAFLVGAKPRGPGMERKDLIIANSHIFQEQGTALNQVAKKTVKTLVVGNPCNTNCLIALKNAPSIDPKQFGALTYLDELRAKALIAQKMEVDSEDVDPVFIWGNHSSTVVPDCSATRISGKKLLIDSSWIMKSWIPDVRNRGAVVIKLRGKSSAASAAYAAAIAGKNFMTDDIDKPFSMGVYSKNNPYEIDPDLVFSFPCGMNQGNIVIEPEFRPEEWIWEQVRMSEKELIEERDSVRHLWS